MQIHAEYLSKLRLSLHQTLQRGRIRIFQVSIQLCWKRIHSQMSFLAFLLKIFMKVFMKFMMKPYVRTITNLNPYWQIMENSSKFFSEIFIFRVVTQAILLENSSIRIFLTEKWSGFSTKCFLLYEFSSKTVSEISQKFTIRMNLNH